jgi:hypothetical protein
MQFRHRALAVVAAAGVALVPALVGASSASAEPGNKSLAKVLLADTTKKGNLRHPHRGSARCPRCEAVIGGVRPH